MAKYFRILIAAILALCLAATSHAGTPISLYQSFGGYHNFVGTGGTLRTQPNTGNSCAVTNSGSAPLSGIPGGSTITAAYLYWAGSYSPDAGSTRTTPDYTITFESQSLTADRSFTETFNYNGTNYDFFSGFKDVTAIVASKGNGTYSFADLSVNNATPHCSVSAVVSGWSLLVVYEHPGERLRMINVFDGFQYYRGSEITLIPSNFRVPASNIDGKHGHISWEGDVENSAPLGIFTENLIFNGTQLTDPTYNPLNNQFNSTTNILGSATAYGVDFDVYDISSYLSPGDGSATTQYMSGGDLVLLSAEVISVTNTEVVDLAITKSHSGNFSVGGTDTFSIDVTNNGPSDENNVVTVTDTLPAGLTYVSSSGTGWTVDTTADPTITWTHNGPLLVGQSLPTIAVSVLVDAAAVPSVSNTAFVSSPTFSHISGNDSSTDTVTVVIPDVSTSTKTVVDLNGGDAAPGDTLRYTIDLIETGGAAANNVSVTDDIPSYVTNFNVVNIPAGATDNSTGAGTGANGNGYLDISGIVVPAGGSVSIVFEVDVSATASNGNTISNTATVINPNGLGATPAAPDVIVNQSQIPASGNKHLYLGAPDDQNNPTLPQSLSRTPLTSEPTPNRIRIRRQDPPVVWALAPATQTPLSLNADIPVVLQLRRNNNNSDRNIRITLDYVGAATGTLGFIDVVVPGSGASGLSNTVTRPFTFTIPTGPVTLPAGTQIRLTVDNSPTTGVNGLAIFVYPYDNATGSTSHVVLDATTVINVDSVQFYDAVYSGGSLLASTTPGTTVYIRSVVSDPFGSFDITGATIDITDPVGTPVVSGAAMTQEADSGAATKTYEYAYTIPLAGPAGSWTARVTANEGTEGTISHSGIGTILVTIPGPDIMMLKSVQVLSDPVSGANPKAIPGAQMLYSIMATNQGSGAVDVNTVIISDPIPANTELYVGDDTFSPVTFIDGGTASGLTFTFTSLSSTTDDISFSDDGGVSFDYSPGPIGYDGNVTHIRINPKGTFNAASGGNNPSFEIRFQVRVE